MKPEEGWGRVDVPLTLSCCHKRALWASEALAANSWDCTLSSSDTQLAS